MCVRSLDTAKQTNSDHDVERGEGWADSVCHQISGRARKSSGPPIHPKTVSQLVAAATGAQHKLGASLIE